MYHINFHVSIGKDDRKGPMDDAKMWLGLSEIAIDIWDRIYDRLNPRPPLKPVK